MKKTRVLSIDFGLVRIGLAVSDERKVLASPLETLFAEKTLRDTAIKLFEFVKKKDFLLDAIVLGNPLHLSGDKSALSLKVKEFLDVLTEFVTIPIILWDERLTTQQADRLMKESGVKRKQRSQTTDSLAAVIILQSYLDAKFNFGSY